MAVERDQMGLLRVAIIGAGPAGLASAIALSRLPHVSWNIYEKGDQVKEIGAGISIQRNTWYVLQKLGAAKNISPQDVYRTLDGTYLRHRNGRTGEIVTEGAAGGDFLHARAHRAVLQNALLKEADQSRIILSSKLVDLRRNADRTSTLLFEDGQEVRVDLVIGADGIRSVTRSKVFPEHRISYTGKTSYRTLMRTSDVEQIPELLNEITFWHGKGGKWVYTCPLGNDVYEVTTMAPEPSEGQERVSWGNEVKPSQMIEHFPEFHESIQKLLRQVTAVQQYALFAGPRLETVVDPNSNIALVGDASHPLSGAFGAGAGFALEDAWTLAESLRWAHFERRPLAAALKLFDDIRSPRYAALYGVLDEFGVVNQQATAAELDFDQDVAYRVQRNWDGRHPWIMDHDVEEPFKAATSAAKGGISSRL